MKRFSKVVPGYLVIALVAAPAAADQIAEVEKKLVQSQQRLESFSAKVRLMQNMDLGGGNAVKSITQGTNEWMRKGDAVMFRTETTGTFVRVVAGQETRSKASTTVISDGQFIYTITDRNGQKTAIKSKTDPKLVGDVRYVLQTLRTHYALKVLPDEKVNGHDCYVIEAVALKAGHSPMVKLINYFAKDLGIVVRIIGTDKGGKMVFASDTTDVKENVDLDPARFIFQPPPGVEVTDLTAQPSK